jgi:hypothetical protein
MVKKSTVEFLQAQVDRLMAERGVPADPVAAAHEDLKAHVAARKAGNPSYDFSELEKTLDVERPTVNDAEKVKLAVEQHHATDGKSETEYLAQLARNLHRATLDDESSTEDDED